MCFRPSICWTSIICWEATKCSKRIISNTGRSKNWWETIKEEISLPGDKWIRPAIVWGIQGVLKKVHKKIFPKIMSAQNLRKRSVSLGSLASSGTSSTKFI